MKSALFLVFVGIIAHVVGFYSLWSDSEHGYETVRMATIFFYIKKKIVTPTHGDLTCSLDAPLDLFSIVASSGTPPSDPRLAPSLPFVLDGALLLFTVLVTACP